MFIVRFLHTPIEYQLQYQSEYLLPLWNALPWAASSITMDMQQAQEQEQEQDQEQEQAQAQAQAQAQVTAIGNAGHPTEIGHDCQPASGFRW